MARLLPPQNVAAALHLLQDVFVADRGAQETDPLVPQRPIEPQVGHDGADDRVAAQASRRLEVPGRQVQDVVTVQEAPGRVHEKTAVGVAVERQTGAHLLPPDFGRQPLRVEGAAVFIDVAAVGLIVNCGHRSPGAPEELGGQ